MAFGVSRVLFRGMHRGQGRAGGLDLTDTACLPGTAPGMKGGVGTERRWTGCHGECWQGQGSEGRERWKIEEGSERSSGYGVGPLTVTSCDICSQLTSLSLSFLVWKY